MRGVSLLCLSRLLSCAPAAYALHVLLHLLQRLAVSNVFSAPSTPLLLHADAHCAGQDDSPDGYTPCPQEVRALPSHAVPGEHTL